MVKVFLDIDIGDAARHAEEVAAFQRVQAFLHECGSQYGLPSSVADLDDEAQQLMQESYDSDPNWSSKGPMSAKEPPALRAGRIVAELFDSEVPKTVENFRCLCTGEKGLGKSSKKPLHLKGNKFHRIVSSFCCQGGDVVRGDGSGGDSIYGGKFNDEKPGLKLRHDAAGILSMANSGKNSNSSQFFFTLAPVPQCDGKHVVFGKVVEGLQILERINVEAASADGTPKGAYKKGDVSAAQSLLTQLKVKLIQLPAVPPNNNSSSATAQQELQLARDVCEHAVLVSLKSQNEDMQESAFTQLKTFYDDTRHVMPPTPQEWVFAGLNLLRLLLANRIAEFHTELELIPEQGIATQHVSAAIQLEQWLMEGAYNKVLAAGAKLPAECDFCVDQLSATVRDEIASCSESAYSSLRLADAQKLMMFKSPKEAEAYAKQRGWTVTDGVIHFHKANAAGDEAGAQHLELINHTLVYAKELERIV